MKRYSLIAGTLLCFMLALFLIAQALNLPLLTDPRPWMQGGGVLAALLGVALLVVDVALPVPSSLVMVAHGALFGVWLGTLLSLTGSLGAALAGFAIGRRGGPLLARLVSAPERERADRLLARWGTLAILVTRPIPLLAETVAILAGASSLSWASLTLATLLGALPGALLYALTGAIAVSFHNSALMFGLVLLVAGCFWLVGRWAEPRLGGPAHLP